MRRRKIAIREARAQRIQRAIEIGANSIAEVADIVDLEQHTILKYEKEGFIKLPREWNRKNIYSIRPNPEVTKLIEHGKLLSLMQIGIALGVSKQESARQIGYQYLHAMGLNNLYLENKQKTLELESIEREIKKVYITKLCYVLEERTNQLAQKEGWASEKAIEYTNKFEGINKIPLENLVLLFQAYNNTRRKNEKLSLEELGTISNICATQVNRILNRVNLEPMYGKQPKLGIRTETPIEIKIAIRRSANVKMPNIDISYFLNIKPHIMNIYSKIYERKNSTVKWITSVGSSGQKLTYRIASQVYEAQDFGFNKEEICELLDLKEELYDYSLRHKKSLSQKIIRILRELYQDKKINTPYMTPDLKLKV